MFNIRLRRKKDQEGQSLVEVALFLPLVLILIAGVTEIGQMLLTSNRVQTAVRTSTRFGANGGENQGMVIVGLNSVTQTLPLTSDRWDMWTIRGLVNDQGTGFEEWEFSHAYGDGETQRFGEVSENDIRTQVLADLRQDQGQQGAADLQFVGTYALFDAESILGFEQFLSNVYSVQALNVMRTFPTSVATNGCSAFPIALEEGTRSLGEEGNPFPTFTTSNSSYPPPGPNAPTLSDFPNHRIGIPIRDAQEGYLYYIQEGGESGGFGWLVWNSYVNANANMLEDNLTWPGRSNDYGDHQGVGGQTPPGFDHPVMGFIENGDATDTSLHIGDRVTQATGAVVSNGVRDTLQEHIENGRAMRFIVWRQGSTGGSGSNAWYEVVGFVVMRLHAYDLPGNQGRILAEFIRWDDSCGQVNALNP